MYNAFQSDLSEFIFGGYLALDMEKRCERRKKKKKTQLEERNSTSSYTPAFSSSTSQFQLSNNSSCQSITIFFFKQAVFCKKYF